MNTFDLLSLGLVGAAAMKGRRRGLPQEAYRLFRWGIGLLAGCGLYSLANQFLSGLFPNVSGLSGFLLGFGGAFALVRTAKTRLIRTLERKVSKERSQKAGLVAGAIRGGIIAMSLATSAHVSPIFPWKGAITESSMVGTVTGWLFQEPASSESTDGSEPDASEDGGEASTFRTDP